jgi:twitching motility protein PilT
MNRLLGIATRMGASDLHLTVGMPPFVRIHGEIILMDEPPLDAARIRTMIDGIMNEEQRIGFERDWELCFSHFVDGLGYFRVTVYRHKGCAEAAVRLGLAELPSATDLGLPPVLDELSRKPNGLLLVTGPTGSGKTTTFNAILDMINRERRAKVITVEDPVEHHHRNLRSIVIQQEVSWDTRSFASALVHILRQDPDVIGIGELRSLDAMSAALTAAETGHLVIATLHASDCPGTIARIVDVFPEAQQQQIRVQLGLCLRGVVNLRLLPRIDRPGRILAYSVLVSTPAAANLIRENKLSQLPNVMKTSRREGMCLMDDMIRDLYQRAVIAYDVAASVVGDPAALLARG